MNGLVLAAAFAVGLVIAVVVFLAVATYNDVIALQRRIDKAWANIEAALQRRHDQLPLLIDAVRGLLAFERDVLVDVSVARAAFSAAAPIPDQAATAAATSRAVRTLLATVERYPAISSAANVSALQDEVERLESIIADRRELYNDQVFRYNMRVAQLPGLLLAGLFGWRARLFFGAAPAAGRPPAGLTDEPDPIG